MSICLYKTDKMYNTTLIADGIGIMFDAGGSFVKAMPHLIPDSSYRQVDVVSVLQYTGGVEIGYIINNVFGKVTTEKPANELLNIIAGSGLRSIFLGIRPINIEGKRAMQYIHIFNRNIVTEAVIKSLVR